MMMLWTFLYRSFDTYVCTVLLGICMHIYTDTHTLETKLLGYEIFVYSILIGVAKQILKLLVPSYTTTKRI